MSGRDVYVFPFDESPLSPGVPPRQAREMVEATGADVFTDDLGFSIGFSGGDDVDALLNDRRFGAVAMSILALSGVTDGELHEFFSNLMFGKDGEEHQAIRSTVSREFTPKAVGRYRPAAVAAARELAAGLDGSGEADLWASFALPLAARVACRAVGIPEERSVEAADWSIGIAGAFFLMSEGRRQHAERAVAAFVGYLDEFLQSRRATPGDDLASVVMAAVDRGELSYEEGRALVANLVFGGLEATAKVITTGVFHLLEHDAWHLLVDAPEKIPAAVEELLRFAPPTAVARLATEDSTCRGIAVQQGQLVLLSLHSACHDPNHFEHPNEIDLDREQGRQLAFGAGAHYCLGAGLARVVVAAALGALTERFPEMTLGDGPDPVEWDDESFEGLVRLQMRTGPARST